MDEIEHIIKNIKTRDIENFSNCDDKKLDMIEQIFNTFQVYPKNKSKNKQQFLKQLARYKYTTFDNIKVGDIVKYIDMRYFFDFKLVAESVVLAKDEENRLLLVKVSYRLCGMNPVMFNYKPHWIRENPMFVKLDNNDMIFMTLVNIMDGKHDDKIKVI